MCVYKLEYINFLPYWCIKLIEFDTEVRYSNYDESQSTNLDIKNL